VKNRRSLLRLLAGATLLSGAGSATAERTKSVTIAYLALLPGEDRATFVAKFMRRLNELGYIDGQNLRFLYRSAEGRPELLPELASELLQMKPDVLVTGFGTVAAKAAKATAGDAVPVIFMAVGDPVGAGIVASLARPGGNVTGLSNGQTDLAGTRLDLLREAIPGLRTLAIIGNRASHNVRLEMDALQKQARKRKIATVMRDMRREAEIAPAINGLKGKADALYVCTDPFVTHHRIGINTLAVGARLPTMHAFRHHIEGGGFMSYGPDFRDLFGGSAHIVHRILRGASPADIPVKLEKKCELVINLHTAKALGLKVPKRISRRATAIR